MAAVGVYDGHCGDRAAKFCRDRLLDTIIGRLGSPFYMLHIGGFRERVGHPRTVYTRSTATAFASPTAQHHRTTFPVFAGDNVFASDAEAAVKNGLVAVTNEFSNFGPLPTTTTNPRVICHATSPTIRRPSPPNPPTITITITITITTGTAKAAEWRDGTTAVVAVVQQDTLVVGNVGDSRAVLGRRLGGTDR